MHLISLTFLELDLIIYTEFSINNSHRVRKGYNKMVTSNAHEAAMSTAAFELLASNPKCSDFFSDMSLAKGNHEIAY